jgi:hypothetical protein
MLVPIMAKAHTERVASPNWLGFFQQSLPLAGIAAAVWLFGVRTPDSVLLGEVLAAFLFVFLAYRFPDVVKIKGLGVELERATKEAQEAAEEAKATVAQVRTAAVAIGQAALLPLAKMGRFGGPIPTMERAKYRDAILSSLDELGCTTEQLAEVRSIIDGSIRFDLVRAVVNEADKAAEKAGIPRTRESKYKQAEFVLLRLSERGEWRSDVKPYEASGIAELRAFLNEFGLANNPSVTERLGVLERYDASGELPKTDD